MLFVSISDPLSIPLVDPSVAIELRLDLFPTIDLNEIADLLKNVKCPVMVTLRSLAHGGKYRGSESERETLIGELLRLEPDFFDVEYDMGKEFISKIIKDFPGTKFIVSCHQLQETPSDLEKMYQEMENEGAYCYKIAAYARSSNDALRMLLFAKCHSNVSVICMGERGQFARVLGKVAGNLIDYAALDAASQTGSGQLTMTEMLDTYHYHSLNGETKVFGLIGDPVEKSPGHHFHNALFKAQNRNAVYVKMTVKQEELSEFIDLSKRFGIHGLSVTIPLKEKILPYLNEVEQPIGAVNTLLFREGKILGINTDGKGCLDAIEEKLSVRDKRVVLLGAGGTARSIAFEAKARGAKVAILNRTFERAENVAFELNCEAIKEIPDAYDILINCSPEPMPVDPEKILPYILVMDVVYDPEETKFLKQALEKQCRIVYGKEMFLNQAQRQNAVWA